MGVDCRVRFVNDPPMAARCLPQSTGAIRRQLRGGNPVKKCAGCLAHERRLEKISRGHQCRKSMNREFLRFMSLLRECSRAASYSFDMCMSKDFPIQCSVGWASHILMGNWLASFVLQLHDEGCWQAGNYRYFNAVTLVNTYTIHFQSSFIPPSHT